MTTVDDPMPLQDALRILRNVSEHNTREIPMPSQVVTAAATVVNQANTQKDLLYETSQLIDEAAVILGVVNRWISRGIAIESARALASIGYIQVACNNIEKIIREDLGHGNS